MAELKRTGIDELRLMARNFGDCRESFNTDWTLEQLVQIHRMWMLSGWDIYPDEWTRSQVDQALEGYPPQWSPYTDKPIVLRQHGPWEIEEGYEHDPRIIDAEYPELDES